MKMPIEYVGEYVGQYPGADPQRMRLKPLARQIRVALLLGLAAGEAVAAPQGGQVVAGQGQIAAPDALTTRVTQQSSNLAIDWQSFNVKSNERVEFRQPGRDAQALNRIFDQNPSQIFGRLDANGRVLLMNPNGVIFGPGAQVNVGSLVAAGLKARVDDFMAGQLHLEGVDGAAGVVVNQGLIAAATGGDVTLVGKAVRNEGVIVATAGRVNLAAGNKVTLDFDGDGLVRFTVDQAVLDNAKALDSAVTNTGTVAADGGSVMMAAKAAADVFSHAVNNAGVIRAARVDSSGGVIRLVATGPEAAVINTGTLDASAAGAGDGGRVELAADGKATLAGEGVIRAAGGAGGKGGEVHVLGTTVELADRARIDVSGPAGGGTALIGGGRGGQDPAIRSAETTTVGTDARIIASATHAGDGGTVIVWSNGLTSFLGQIEARGGAAGGDGGFAEISGHHLGVTGHADLRAPAGQAGALLFDPGQVNIVHGGSGVAGLDTFSDGYIDAQLAAGTLQIKTANAGPGNGPNGDIVFASDVAISWSTANKLWLVADRNVALAGSISGTNPGAALQVDFGQGGTGGALGFNGVTLGGGLSVTANGGAGTNTLTGSSSGSTFTPTSATGGTLSVSGTTVTYTGVTKLVGGAAADTFDINVNLPAGTTLSGGGGGDTFNLANGVSVADPIDGGGGAIVNGPNAATTWTVTGAAAVGVTGAATANFTGIGTLNGAGGANALTGPNTATTWMLTGAGVGTVNGLAFTGMQGLTGGSADDTFQFKGGAITGTLDGGAGGTNTLDYTTDAGPITVDLGGATATRTGGIANIGTLIGNDSNTTLVGTAGSDTFAITTHNAGTVGGLGFSKVTRLAGGSAGSDSFVFSDGVTLSGTIDGGGGTATLDFSAYTAAQAFALDATGTAHGFKGHVAAIAGGAANGFDNIDTLIGGSNSGDALTGLAAVSTWNLGPAKTYVSTNTLTFSAIENLNAGGAGANTFNVSQNHSGTLTGGTGNDRFNFSGSAVLTGVVNGGAAGTDVLDFSAYGSAVAVHASGNSGKGDVSGAPDPIVGAPNDFTNIAQVTGVSTIFGPNGQTNDWVVTGLDTFTLNGTAFTGDHVVGGDQIDNFTVDSGGRLSAATGIDGSAGANTLSTVAAGAFSITGNDAGSLTTAGLTTTFTNIQTLKGGANADTFTFTGAFQVAGITGGGGSDTLDWSGFGSARTIAISALDASGATGSDLSAASSLTGTFSGIATIKSAAGGVLTAADQANTWVVNAPDGGTLASSGGTLAFVNFGTLHGGTGSDTVTISGGKLSGSISGGGADSGNTLTGDNTANTWTLSADDGGSVVNATGTVAFTGFANLTGGANDDTFAFQGTHTIAGTVDGGAHVVQDTFDYSAATGPITVNAASLVNIERVIGSGNAGDTLIGIAAGNTFHVTANDAGALNGSLAFTNIANLKGGAGNDTFTFDAGVKVGSIDGLGGTNTLSLAAYTTGQTFAIGAANDAGTVNGMSFANVQNVTAGSGNDTFTFSNAGRITGAVDGGAGTNTFDFSAATTAATVNLGAITNIQNLIGSAHSDTLSGTNAGETFNITADNAGNVGGITFSSFENLHGGSGNDSFVFAAGAFTVTSIDGGAGTDTLDWSAYGSSRTVTITSLGASGAAGTEASLTGGFSAIEAIKNPTGAAGQLTGPNAANVWTVNGTNAGTLASGGGTLAFTDFATLTGGTGTNSFVLTGGGRVSGSLSGGGAATGNTLTADNAANVWTLSAATAGSLTTLGGPIAFSGIANFVGNANSDSFVFASGVTALAGTIDGQGGTNTILFAGSGVTVDLGKLTNITSVDADNGAGTGQGSGNTLLAAPGGTTFTVSTLNAGTAGGIAFARFENLTGGAGNDQFVFTSGGGNDGHLTGSVDGGGGTNTIDFSGSALVQLFTSTGLSQGTILNDPLNAPAQVDLIHGPFTNVQTVTGNGLGSLYGPNVDTIWLITGLDSGSYGATGAEDAFNNFRLFAGAANDDFRISGTGRISGGIDGGGGANTLRGAIVGAPLNTVNTWVVNGTSAGTLTNGAGLTTFAKIGTLVAGDLGDTFTLSAGFTGNIHGGAGNDAFNVNASMPGSITDSGGHNTFTLAPGVAVGGALTGGIDADDFRFGSGASVTGAIDGGGGTNTLDWSATGTAHAVTLTALGTTVGFKGTEAGIGGGFDNITGLVNPALGGGVLTGANLANTWAVTGGNDGTVTSSGRTLTFSQFSALNGGSAADTFNVSGNHTGNLGGGGGDDAFVFTGAAVLTGAIDGGTGANTLDWSGYGTGRSVVLTALGAAGATGTEASITGGFANIESIVNETGAAGSLTGPNATNLWTITGANAGTLASGGGTLAFTAFPTLLGGTGADTFVITANAAGTLGRIDGGSGLDTLSFAGNAGAASIAVTGPGTIDGVQGTEHFLASGFDDIEVAVGSGHGDTLADAGPGPTIWAVGGSDSYTSGGRTLAFSAIANLSGGAGNDTFNVTGSHTGTLNGGDGTNVFNIGGVGTVLTGSLVGGAGNDSFVFANDARITGSLDGGAGGTDTLDWSASTHAVTLTLLNIATLDRGDLAPLIGATGPGFIGIDNFVTNSALSTITGPNADATWTITGANAFTIQVGVNTANFTHIGNLQGGSANDDFVFTGGTLSGRIDGGAGTNRLTAGNVVNQWTLTGPAAGTVTGLGGGFANITNVTGGSADDTFVVVGASAFAGAIDGGGGTNTIQGGDVANTWHLNGANAGDIGGKSAFTNVSQIVGGGADDAFQFSGAASYATLDGGAGTNRLDYGALAGPITVDLKNHTASLITTPGGATNFDALTGSASAADTLIGGDSANTWTVTAANQGTLGSFVFTGVENLTGGAAADRFVVSGPGKLLSGTMDGGAGTNEVVGNGVVNAWNITGTNAGTMNGNAFTNVQNLTAQGANATLTFAAAAGIAGTFTAPQVTLATATIDTGGVALTVQGNVVAGGAQSITAGAITIGGNVNSSGPLTLASAAAPIAIGGALTSAAGFVATTSGGSFTLGGDLSTNGATGITAGAGAIALGGGVDTHGGAFSAQAPAGSFSAGGAITAGSVALASSATAVGAVTTAGSQTYAGSTTFGGDLHGADLVFDGSAAIAADVLLESSTNTFTFNGAVLGGHSLDINPTAGTDLVIDTTPGPRHIASTAFSGYQGHLIIGGILTPRTGPAEDAAVTAINADRIAIDSPLATHGDVTLLASNIDLLADLAAIGGQVTLLAVGDTQGKGSPAGDITGPTGSTAAITADKAVLIANNAIVNNQNIQLDLNGGPVLVAVSSSVQQPTFDPASNATSQTFDPTTLKIIASLTNPIGVQAVQVVFSNPAAALTGLQNVQFVDVGVFEQDLTLFGVLGNGIALSLDQCEDKEGCAPNVTDEELDKLIEGLKARIAELERHGGTPRLLDDYRRQLGDFQGYKKQLHDYEEAQEESRSDKFEEFDEGALGGEKGKAAVPAAPTAPAAVEKPSAAQPRAIPKVAPAAKPAEFEELDETLDDKPKTVAPAKPAPAAPAAKPIVPSAPAPKPAKPAGKPADSPDEFEELEEQIDDSMILSLAAAPGARRRGAVGLDAAGRVRWRGELVLPAVHARY